jgi:hypothetical protein
MVGLKTIEDTNSLSTKKDVQLYRNSLLVLRKISNEISGSIKPTLPPGSEFTKYQMPPVEHRVIKCPRYDYL